MKKKILVIVLSCLVGISSVPEVVMASSMDEAAQEQETANLELRDNNVQEAVEGAFTYQVVDGKAYLVSYNGEDEELVVPSALGGYPLEKINHGAIREKSNLKSITFSEGLKSMEGEGIFRCENLESVYFPSTFMSGINSNVRGMGGMINECGKLSTVTVSEENEALCVYEGALYTKNMKTLILYPPADQRNIFRIPDGVEIIGDDSCRNGYVKEVIMPDTVTYIGYWAFCDASSLEKMNISEKCEIIGQFAIQRTQIKKLHIPASVTGIFIPSINCNLKLEEITVDENNPVYHSHEGVLYSKTSVFAYPPAKAAECYEVEDGISYIEMYAFDWAKNLKKVVLPNTMQGIGTSAFSNCPNLEEINLPNGISYMGVQLFVNCDKPKKFIFPYSMEEIPEDILGIASSATVQENVKQIQKQSSMGYLQEIYFAGDVPKGIENIVSMEENRKLPIYYPDGNATWEAAIRECSNPNIIWLPHTHSISDERVEDWPATCERAGQNSRHCTVCGAVIKDQIIEVLGHPVTEIREAKEASCTESGYTGDKCCVACNKKLESGKEIPAKGHQWDKGKVTKTATYAQIGTRLYTCSVCGGTREESIDMLKLAQPKISSAENVNNGVSVKWNKVKGASGYRIYRKSGKGTWSQIAQVKSSSSTNYIDTKTDDGKAYAYTVSAYNGKNESTYSQKGETVIRLQAPKISQLKNKSAKSFIVKWTKNSKAKGYQIQYSTSSKFKKVEKISVSANTLSKEVKKLSKGKKYYVRVRACKKSGKDECYSAWSSVKSVKINK